MKSTGPGEQMLHADLSRSIIGAGMQVLKPRLKFVGTMGRGQFLRRSPTH